MQLTENTILAELKANGNLPSPTGVALTILDLTRNPDTSTEDMATVLQADPALTGQILKFANSASASSRESATSINDALVRLGMATIRQLCLGFSILSNARSGPCSEFDYKTYWTRSLAMGVSCQVLSKKIKAVSPDEGFTCGLLSGIGQLALASVYPKQYDQILDDWDKCICEDVEISETKCLLDLENKALNIDNNAVASLLFEDWGLPAHYGEGLKKHQTTPLNSADSMVGNQSREMKLARVLNIAAQASDICLETGPKRHRMVLDYMAIASVVGISDEIWMGMFDEILEEWDRMGAILDVVTSNVPSMENLISRAECFKGTIPPRKRKKGKGKSSLLTTDSTGLDPVPLEMPETTLANRPVTSKTDKPTSTGLTILVATDSPVDMRILEKKLTAAGHNLHLAKDGREALNSALQNRPQLILTDWRMPEIDGLELCSTLRQSKQVGNIYTIIMTAQAGNDELIEAFEAGIDDYLIKPLNYRVMNARLQAAKRLIDLQEQAATAQEEIRRTMSELGIANRKLLQMALEDTLTKLPNRRAGLDQLSKEWSRSTRTNEPMLVMILDIDFFKKVNDTYGHDAGDVVLQKTALAMQDTMRTSDTVCRYGGEEFLVICPGADVEVAKEMGDRLRKAVQNNHIATPEYKGSITVSIGVCVRNSEHTSYADMIKSADEALYAAKEAGRNLVCIT